MDAALQICRLRLFSFNPKFGFCVDQLLLLVQGMPAYDSPTKHHSLYNEWLSRSTTNPMTMLGFLYGESKGDIYNKTRNGRRIRAGRAVQILLVHEVLIGSKAASVGYT